jgi:hypothetical protein
MTGNKSVRIIVYGCVFNALINCSAICCVQSVYYTLLNNRSGQQVTTFISEVHCTYYLKTPLAYRNIFHKHAFLLSPQGNACILTKPLINNERTTSFIRIRIIQANNRLFFTYRISVPLSAYTVDVHAAIKFDRHQFLYDISHSTACHQSPLLNDRSVPANNPRPPPSKSIPCHHSRLPRQPIRNTTNCVLGNTVVNSLRL